MWVAVERSPAAAMRRRSIKRVCDQVPMLEPEASRAIYSGGEEAARYKWT